MELVLDQISNQCTCVYFLIPHCLCFLDGQMADNIPQPEGLS